MPKAEQPQSSWPPRTEGDAPLTSVEASAIPETQEGYAWATPDRPGLLPASERERRPLPSFRPVEPPSPESLNAEAGAMSQRHADMEDAGRVPVSWPSAGLSVEEMAAPTRRGSDIPEPSSAPSSAPEESGVFVRKAKPVGGEIAPRHQKHYSEVERLGPDTFLGHGQAPSGPNVPSVIDEIDEEPSRGEMVAQKAQHDTIAASSRRKPKAA